MSDTLFWSVTLVKHGAEEDETETSDRIYVVASKSVYAKQTAEKLRPGFTAVDAEPCSLQYAEAMAAMSDDARLRNRKS